MNILVSNNEYPFLDLVLNLLVEAEGGLDKLFQFFLQIFPSSLLNFTLLMGFR